MPPPGPRGAGDSGRGGDTNNDPVPWGFVMATSSSLFSNQTGTMETRTTEVRDKRNRAAIRTVGRSGTVSSLSDSLRLETRGGLGSRTNTGYTRKPENDVSALSSSSDTDDDDESNRQTLRELLRERNKKSYNQSYANHDHDAGAERTRKSTADALSADIGQHTTQARELLDQYPMGKQSGFRTPSGAKAPATTPAMVATPAFSMTKDENAERQHRLERLKGARGDVLNAAGQRTLAIKLQAMEEPPIMMTPVQRKYLQKWVDKQRGTLRTVADVALAALKKAKSDEKYAAQVRAESEQSRLARLEELRLTQGDFKRSDPRVLWKKASDVVRFVWYVKRLLAMTKKANATAAVRAQKMERLAAEAAAAEAAGETISKSSRRESNNLDSTSKDDPITLNEMERKKIAESLLVTKQTLSSRFGDNSGSFGSAYGKGVTANFISANSVANESSNSMGSDVSDASLFTPKLGQQNAKLLKTAGRNSKSLTPEQYKELSFHLKEEEEREAKERFVALKAQQEFHWRPVIRVRLANTLPLELFLDDDDEYDDAVITAGKTLCDAGVKESGARAETYASDGASDFSQFDDFGKSIKQPVDKSKNTRTSSSGKIVEVMDEETALKIALDRRRRAAKLSRAYDANLLQATDDLSSMSNQSGRNSSVLKLGTKSFASVSGKIVMKDALGWRGGSGKDGGGQKHTNGSFSMPKNVTAPAPMRFHTSDLDRKTFDNFGKVDGLDSQLYKLQVAGDKKEITEHYGKWYIPSAKRSTQKYQSSEKTYFERKGGAQAAEMKQLTKRESAIATKNSKSYAARLYKSWLDVRVGMGKQSGNGDTKSKSVRIPEYLQSVEPSDDAADWWPVSTAESENFRLKAGGGLKAKEKCDSSLKFAS